FDFHVDEGVEFMGCRDSEQTVDIEEGDGETRREIRFEKNDGERVRAVSAGDGLYQVSGPWDDQVVVNVMARTCTCRRWELTSIPCKHG
ncbi:mutator type transposase, partial [Tanacetum coccineum]